MANYENLKAAIEAAIYPNGRREVTAAAVQGAIEDVIDSLGEGYQLLGVAQEDTRAGEPDERVCYLATAGVYRYFGLTVGTGNMALFYYDGEWRKYEFAIVTEGAISTDKLADESVTSGKIAEGAVGTDKIADDGVTSDKIADGAVGTDKMADNSVVAGKIADGAVGYEKLAEAVAGRIEDTYTRGDTYSKEELNSLITTPDQQYQSYAATVGTTSIATVLPAEGDADTIYRVGNWDGTQYNVNRYAEYAWNGTAYVLLSVKGFNLDAVPTAGSSNGVESGGVHRWFEEGLGLVRTPVSVTKNTGSYVSNTGSAVSLELGYITDPVQVKGGDVIELYTRSSQYATSIMITNAVGTILTLAKKGTGPGTSPWQTLHYYVQADCYVKFSGLEECTVYKISTRQDKAIEDIRIHDYFDELATTAWKGVIKELYIDPKYLYKNTFEVDFLSRQTSAKVVGVGADGVTTTWEAETSHIFPHSEGTCFGIYCTTAGGEAAVNDIIGYVIVDIAIFKTTQPTTLGNKLNLAYATNIDLCPSLSSVVNRSAREPIAEVLSLFVGKGITDLSEGIIAQSSRGYLIKASNGAKEANANSHISAPMLLNEGDFLCGYCRLTTYLACLSKTDSGGTSYTPVYIGEGTAGDCPWQAWRYVVQESGYYALCWFGVSDVERPYFYKFDGTIGDGELMAFNLLSAYTNITCLGDSLTWSQVSTGEGTYRQAKRTFPQVLGGLCGSTGLAIGNPGDTAKRWWDTFSAQLIARTNNVYIVYLGTNGGLTDTIDTDCAGDDITNYADTNTGCYGKILGSIKALGDKAILVKINTVAYAETTNAVIEKFGDKFGFPVVGNDRIDNLLYHYYPDGSGYDNLHLNDLGYCYFANRLLKDIDGMTDAMKRRLVVTE